MRFHIAETLDEYIATLSDLVTAIEGLKDVLFVIRPHPCCDLTQEEFRLLLPFSSKVTIIDEGSFQNVLSVADLMVSYSSTCIEEALQNNIPVLLYDRWARYNHFNITEWVDLSRMARQPAYYLTQPQGLSLAIDKILNLFDKAPLTDYDLEIFKYPKEARKEYLNFVDESLNA